MGDNKKVIIVAVATGTVFCILGLIVGALFLGSSSTYSLFSTSRQDKNVENETTVEKTETEVKKDVIRHPGYKLMLGSQGYLNIPEGWYVEKITSNYYDLDLESDTLYSSLVGLWPIHDRSEIVLTNGSSEIVLSRKALFIPITTGFLPEPFDIEGYTIVKEAVNPMDDGAVRVKDGESWVYSVYTNAGEEGCMGEGESEYCYGISYNNIFDYTFTGSNNDLDIADKLFIESVLEGNFSLVE